MDKVFFYLILLFLPTQLGKHFWPSFSYVLGTRVDYLSPTIYLTDVLIFALFASWVLPQLKYPISNIKYPISNIFSGIIAYWKVMLLLIFILIGILFSKNQMSGLYGLAKIMEFLFFGYYAARTLTTEKKLQEIIFIFSLGIFLQSGLSIFQYLNQASIGGVFYFLGERTFNAQTPGIANAVINGELLLRPYGTFPHPNVLAGYLIIGLFMVMSSVLYSIRSGHISNGKRSFFIATVAIGSIGIFLTMSRVTIILWFFALIYFIVSFLRKTLNKNIGLVIALLIIISIGYFSYLSPLGARFLTFNLADESFVQRQELIQSSLLMIKDNPVFGVGLNNFLYNLPYYYNEKSLSLFSYLQPVHNIYLLVLTQTGIVGFSFFFWFVLKTIQRVKNKELRIKKNIAIIHNSKFIILSIVLVLGLFDHYFLTLQQGQLLLAFVIGFFFSKFDGKIKTMNNKIK